MPKTAAPLISGLQADLGLASPDHLVSAGPVQPLPNGGRLTGWNPAAWPVAAGWAPVIEPFLVSNAGQELGCYMRERLESGAVIYPPQPFRALQCTARAEVRVVILGQDPYHGPGQAHGLAFSVPDGIQAPPSLRNIFKELARDPLRSEAPVAASSLDRWTRQGVLLLNTCLTVEHGLPASHAGKGWEVLTDQLVQAVADGPNPVVFMLWGAHAQAKAKLIRSAQHLVLMANHPSPLSALRPPRPFIGCGHFSAANVWLQQHGHKAIRW